MCELKSWKVEKSIRGRGLSSVSVEDGGWIPRGRREDIEARER